MTAPVVDGSSAAAAHPITTRLICPSLPPRRPDFGPSLALAEIPLREAINHHLGRV